MGTKKRERSGSCRERKACLALLQEEGLAPGGALREGEACAAGAGSVFWKGVTEPTNRAGAQAFNDEDELAEGVRLACEARVSAPCCNRIEPDDKNLAVLLDGE